MGGPSIKPIEPLLHIRRSNRDAARSDAIVASINESVDAMLSIVGMGMIVIFFLKSDAPYSIPYLLINSNVLS